MGHSTLGAKITSLIKDLDSLCGTNAGQHDTRIIRSYLLNRCCLLRILIFYLRWIEAVSGLILASVIAAIADFNYSSNRMQCYRNLFMYRLISDSSADNMYMDRFHSKLCNYKSGLALLKSMFVCFFQFMFFISISENRMWPVCL